MSGGSTVFILLIWKTSSGDGVQENNQVKRTSFYSPYLPCNHIQIQLQDLYSLLKTCNKTLYFQSLVSIHLFRTTAGTTSCFTEEHVPVPYLFFPCPFHYPPNLPPPRPNPLCS